MEGAWVPGSLCEESRPLTRARTIKGKWTSTAFEPLDGLGIYLFQELSFPYLWQIDGKNGSKSSLLPGSLSYRTHSAFPFWVGLSVPTLHSGSATTRPTVVNRMLTNITQTNVWKRASTFSLSPSCSPDIAVESKHRLACCRVRCGDQSWAGTGVSASPPDTWQSPTEMGRATHPTYKLLSKNTVIAGGHWDFCGCL